MIVRRYTFVRADNLTVWACDEKTRLCKRKNGRSAGPKWGEVEEMPSEAMAGWSETGVDQELNFREVGEK